jgi:predicted KAP-like P-loop ATPase
MTYPSDIPLSKPSEDRLGYAKIAKNIAVGIIDLTEPCGFVISINAKWGSGKTSFLNFIKFYLVNYENKGGILKDNENVPIIINFNPWWFSGKEDLFRQFFGQFGLGLSNEVKSTIALTRLLGQYFVAISKINLPYDATMDMIEGSFNPEKMDVFSLKQKIIDELPKDRKIIFVIDDIDRLDPDEVKQLFQVIKKVADFPNVIYILAFDSEIVEPMLNSGQELSGSKYLEKIVQAPFHLPIPTKCSLNLIFCEKLTEIMGDFPKELWNKSHWFHVYDQGLSELINTPRSIVRLTNALRVTYPPIRDEVNPIDFVALEAIRIFQPDCYQRIQKDNEKFFGHASQIWDHQRTELAAYHTSWINELKGPQKEAIQNIIKSLFPVVASVLNSQDSIDCHDQHKSRRELRICCPEFFSRYYWMTVPQASISAEEFEKIRLTFSNSEQFGTELLNIANNGQLGLTKFNFLMQKMIDHSQDIPKELISEIIKAIYNVYDQIILIDFEINGDNSGLDSYKTRRLTKLLLSRVEESERINTISQIITSSESFWILSDVFSIIDDPKDNSCEALTFDFMLSTQILFSSESIDELKKQIVNKIKKSAELDQLEKIIHISRILYIWNEWDPEPNAKKWVQDRIKNDAGLIFILEKFSIVLVGSSHGLISKRREINFESLNKFIEIAEVRAKIIGSIERLKRNSTLSTDQKEIVTYLDRMLYNEARLAEKPKGDLESLK